MGMSGIERKQMRAALGLEPGVPCSVNGMFSLPAAWMREILQENSHLNNEMHKFYELNCDARKEVVALRKEIEELKRKREEP